MASAHCAAELRRRGAEGSVLRAGKGFVPTADTVLEEGDEILAVLDPGKEDDLKVLFGPEGNGSNGG